MICFITSCNRLDLLERTITSLLTNQAYPLTRIVVHEDTPDPLPEGYFESIHRIQSVCHEKFGVPFEVVYTGGIGQHASIEKFLERCEDEFYLHCEDDWEFDNSYDWIHASMSILVRGENRIKVVCRKKSPHPCEYNMEITHGYRDTDGLFLPCVFGQLKPWSNNGIEWYGFTWNPGVTSSKLLREALPFLNLSRVYRPGYIKKISTRLN